MMGLLKVHWLPGLIEQLVLLSRWLNAVSLTDSFDSWRFRAELASSRHGEAELDRASFSTDKGVRSSTRCIIPIKLTTMFQMVAATAFSRVADVKVMMCYVIVGFNINPRNGHVVSVCSASSSLVYRPHVSPCNPQSASHVESKTVSLIDLSLPF